jgi:hypothetical protein
MKISVKHTRDTCESLVAQTRLEDLDVTLVAEVQLTWSNQLDDSPGSEIPPPTLRRVYIHPYIVRNVSDAPMALPSERFNAQRVQLSMEGALPEDSVAIVMRLIEGTSR